MQKKTILNSKASYMLPLIQALKIIMSNIKSHFRRQYSNHTFMNNSEKHVLLSNICTLLNRLALDLLTGYET